MACRGASPSRAPAWWTSPAWPQQIDTHLAGLLPPIPDLVALDLPALVATAGYPGTAVIPAVSSVLSLLAFSPTGTRRVSHVEELATDPGAALFAGLTSLPKATALSTYSYRLDHAKQAAFLAALDKASVKAGLGTGDAVNLDFHAVMHWGHDPALEKHYVPSKESQRTRSVLTFLPPRTPTATPCSTPTRTWPRPPRTTKSSPSPTTGTP